jgi:hypothetical protein
LQAQVKCGNARTDTGPVLTLTLVLIALIAIWGGLVPLHRRRARDLD